MESSISRRSFVTSVVLGSIGVGLMQRAGASQDAPPTTDLTLQDLEGYERVAGITLTEAERKAVLAEVNALRKGYDGLRSQPIENSTDAMLYFAPVVSPKPGKTSWVMPPTKKRDVDAMSNEDVAFLPAYEQAKLIRQKKLSSEGLVGIYCSQISKFGDLLSSVVTVLEQEAIDHARELDRDAAAGRWAGPLHGLPYGLKDLFATLVGPTTWGASPYREQVMRTDAEVVKRLDAAGAVLLAKTTVGALAMGDEWYGGKTKNPWNVKRGSSGSSAGSAAGTAAGLFSFAIGTETLGSICSPSWECRVTGFRPTFGAVSRRGCMSLSFSMDKVGPITRTVADAALVFAQLKGKDPYDNSTTDFGFAYNPRVNLKGLRVALVKPQRQDAFSYPLIQAMRDAGVSFVETQVPVAGDFHELILTAEAASAFDELTRSGRVNEIERSSWPQYFRLGRHIPAVEYIQAQRSRRILAEAFESWWETEKFDFIITPDIGFSTIFLTNLTGNPQAIIPDKPSSAGISRSVSVIGKLYQDDRVLELAAAIQALGNAHLARPTL
jgi:Asp-tRNA(Asn)/Glu-tRNA(Gln) amidotransferase A subunit family amidase